MCLEESTHGRHIWLDETIADIWMKESVQPRSTGHCKMDEGETVEDIQNELEKQAISSGYDYHFHDIDEDITYHII